MKRVDDLKKAQDFREAFTNTVPDLKAEITRLRASNDRLSDDGIKLQFEIGGLWKEIEELKDRNSTYLMRLKSEEQNREGWQHRAEAAEAELRQRAT